MGRIEDPPMSRAIVWAGMTRSSSARAAVAPSGSAVTTSTRAPAPCATPQRAEAVGSDSGPRGTQEEVAGSQREGGHVALHADLEAEVMEAHRQRPHHQALASAAEEHHATCAGDGLHRRLQAGLVHASGELGELRRDLADGHVGRRPARARCSRVSV